MFIGHTDVTREPEWTDRDREHVVALQEIRANQCPKCGGPLDQTTDEHIAWDVKYDECNRCETVAWKQAKDNGADDKEARKQAAPVGRLYRATAVPNP